MLFQYQYEKKDKTGATGYWKGLLESYGFRRDSLHDGTARIIWYCKGNFCIGFDSEDFRDGLCPSFYVSYEEAPVMLTRVRLMLPGFSLSFEYRGEESILIDPVHFIEVIDAVSDQKRLPLAVGFEWMSGVLEAALTS